MDSLKLSPSDPRVLAEELVRPEGYREMYLADSIPPEPTVLESTEVTLGTKPLDAKRYYSQEFFDLENTKLWPRVWQYAAWAYDIEKPGDIAVYRNAGRSALIVRQRDGSVKAFANSCLHRGRELCTEEVQNQELLRCPFHGFTWNLEGSLAWYPCKWDFPQVTPETHRLPEIRCEEWNGFIFINFDNDAKPLNTYLGKMVEQWASTPNWDFHKRFKAVHVNKRMNLNWKVAQEAFIESFHAFFSHPGTEHSGDSVSAQYDVWEDEPHFSRMISAMARPSAHLVPPPSDDKILDEYLANFAPELIGTEEGRCQPGETVREAGARLSRTVYQQRTGVDMSAQPASYTLDTIEYFVFPNFFPWPSIGAPLVYRFLPGDSPEKCTFEVSLFIPFSGERPPSAKTIHVDEAGSLGDVPELGALGWILQQDVDNLESMQRGLRASIANKITLSRYQEVRIRHYHQTLDKYLSDSI
jgi:phenylpropionate dioxygenase-like ring-hydroxylating dioxygenase large terminal subunit